MMGLEKLHWRDIRMFKSEINFGTRTIEYSLERKVVKNINLTVKPSSEVYVSANHETSLELIENLIRSKGNWIIKNIDYFDSVRPLKMPEKDFVSGESFRYLGRQYRLKVIESNEDFVKFYRGYIYLYTREIDNRLNKERLLKSWYDRRRTIIFREALDRIYPLVKNHGVEYPELKFRKMKNRWGSCYINEKKIILNEVLIKAPKDCIDYVILHELIHFIYKNHDENFYKMLFLLMPDWEERKNILDSKIIMEL